MANLIDRYLSLIKTDRDYLKKYYSNDLSELDVLIKNTVEASFKWRKLKNMMKFGK